MGTTNFDALEVGGIVNATTVQQGGSAIPAPADLTPLTDGSNADALHVHALAGITDAGTAAAAATGDFATAAQGGLADTATQPGDLATVATTGAYGDLSGTPTLGTAAAEDVGYFATAAQGALADTAVQPGDLGTAAALDTGTTAGTIPVLDGTGKLPAVDGSQLTNLPASAGAIIQTVNLPVGGMVATNYLFAINDTGGTLTFSDVTASFLGIMNGVWNPPTEYFAAQLISWTPGQYDDVATNSDLVQVALPTSGGSFKLLECVLTTITAIPSGDYYGIAVTCPTGGVQGNVNVLYTA